MSMKEYLRILGLKETADQHELNVQYRKKIRQYHPDLFAGDPTRLKAAEEKTKKLNLAYSELKKVLPPRKTPVKKNAEIKKAVKPSKDKERLKEEKVKFDFFASVSDLLTLLTKPRPKPEAPEKEQSVQKSLKSETRHQFKDILKNKLENEKNGTDLRKSYSSVYRELQKKRARYGNRQQDGSGEKGAIGPISPVSPIKTGRIR